MTARINETKAEGDKRRQFNRELGPVPESAHGKHNGYTNYNCKCDRCMEWCRLRSQKRRAAAKDLAQYQPPKERVEPEKVEWSLEFIRSLLK